MQTWEEKAMEREEGRREGWIAGEREGRIAGEREGRIEGRNAGSEETRREIIGNMRESLSVKEIAQLLKMEEDEVEKILQIN